MNWNNIFNSTIVAEMWDGIGKILSSMLGIGNSCWPSFCPQVGWLVPILLFLVALPIAFKMVEVALSAMGFETPGEAIEAARSGIDARVQASRFNSGLPISGWSGPQDNPALSPFMNYSSDKMEEPFSPDGNQYPASMREMFEPGTVTFKQPTTADRVAMREKVAKTATPEEMQRYDESDNGGLRSNKEIWQ